MTTNSTSTNGESNTEQKAKLYSAKAAEHIRQLADINLVRKARYFLQLPINAIPANP
jgi:hypothetical protein